MGKQNVLSGLQLNELQTTRLTQKEIETELDEMYLSEKLGMTQVLIQERISILLEEHAFVCQEIDRLKKGLSSKQFYAKK